MAYTEWMRGRPGVLPSRYVYRVPAADFDPALLGGSYNGNISRARVVEANAHPCHGGGL